MPNGHVLTTAIKEASECVAREGWADADLRVVMLAGFDYLAHEIRRPTSWKLKSAMSGVMMGCVGVGAGVVQLLHILLK